MLRGEPGIGKTALLKEFMRADTGCRIEHLVGVESEMELAFAGLHQLCAPMLGYLDRLPEAHRDALHSAFGLAARTTPDRFFLGLAVLEMLTEIAEERPLICIVDDSQWLDRSTAQVLGFVARRLRCESVALLFVVRESREEFIGLPELRLDGLSVVHARALLEDAIHRPLDPRVLDRIVAETGGNPLGLLELSGEYGDRMGGGFAIPRSGQLSRRLEDRFLRDARRLPAEAQRLMRLAAADPLGDPVLLRRAAAYLGLSFGPEFAADTGGLIEFAARVRFHHPLVRSAVYRSATDAQRREVHLALGRATDPERDPDRRIWHLAQATEGADDEIADELERSAGRARERGGLAAVGAFLVRSASLTADPLERGRRMVQAAMAEHQAGSPREAEALLAAARAGSLSDADEARAELVSARVVFDRTRGSDAPLILLKAARQLEVFDHDLSRDAYLEALLAGLWTVSLTGGEAQEVAATVPVTQLTAAAARPVDLLLAGWATLLTEGIAAGTPLIRRAVDAFRQQPTITVDEIPAAWAAFTGCAQTWDLDGWSFMADRFVPAAREAGALPLLSLMLVAAGSVYLQQGRFLEAETMLEESQSIANDIGLPSQRYLALLIRSWRGHDAATLTLAEEVTAQASARGEGFAHFVVELALLRLHNAHGQYEAAVAAVPGWMGRTLHIRGPLIYGELLEAAIRCGRKEVAEYTIALITEEARACRTDWGFGEEALGRAQLSEGAAAGPLYREAIARLEHCGALWRAARTHLLYGEWLRRQGERAEARSELRTAHDLLSGMHAHAFAERAARELKATGATSRRYTHQVRDELTPQERQIAEMAGDGLTNREIGERLYLSHRTIGSHLYRIYPKLGVASRSELGPALHNHPQATTKVGSDMSRQSRDRPSPRTKLNETAIA